MFFYLWIDVHSNFIQFHYCLIVHQRPLNWNRCKLHENLMIFDELSNLYYYIKHLRIGESIFCHGNFLLYPFYPSIRRIIFIVG
jgi:hypothetical protein